MPPIQTFLFVCLFHFHCVRISPHVLPPLSTPFCHQVPQDVRPKRAGTLVFVHPCFQCLGHYLAQSRHAGWLKFRMPALMQWSHGTSSSGTHCAGGHGGETENRGTEGQRSSPSPPVHLCFPVRSLFLLPVPAAS